MVHLSRWSSQLVHLHIFIRVGSYEVEVFWMRYDNVRVASKAIVTCIRGRRLGCTKVVLMALAGPTMWF